MHLINRNKAEGLIQLVNYPVLLQASQNVCDLWTRLEKSQSLSKLEQVRFWFSQGKALINFTVIWKLGIDFEENWGTPPHEIWANLTTCLHPIRKPKVTLDKLIIKNKLEVIDWKFILHHSPEFLSLPYNFSVFLCWKFDSNKCLPFEKCNALQGVY